MSTVLLVIANATGAGGTERMVANLARILCKRHKVAVSSFDKIGSQLALPDGVTFHPLGRLAEFPLALRWITYARQAFRLRRLKREIGPTLTISNLWRADLVSQLAGGRDRKVAVCHINILGNPANRMLRRMRHLTGYLYRRFDKVVAVSPPLLDEVRNLYRLRPDKAVCIENFVSVPAGPAVPPPVGRLRVVWCGRVVPEKNTLALIDVFCALRERNRRVQLVLIGDGAMRATVELRAIGAGLRLGNLSDPEAEVVFTGALTDPFPIMRGASLLLLPSQSEGLPLVVLEALAIGLPVAAADAAGGGVRSILAPSSGPSKAGGAQWSPAGVLLPIPSCGTPSSIACWADAIDLILRQPAMLAALQDGARARAVVFSQATAAPRWLALLEEAVEGESRTVGPARCCA